VIFEKLDQVEQRALGLDGETDYVEEFSIRATAVTWMTQCKC